MVILEYFRFFNNGYSFLNHSKDLESRDEAILLLCEDDDDAEADAAESADLNGQLRDMVAQLTARLAEQVSNMGSGRSFRHPTEQADSSFKGPKLPKLQITKFDGDPIHWAEFWDDFSGTVHERKDLSEATKFKYLKACLEKDALSVAEGFRLTAANYQQVIRVLEERFGNNQLIVFSHFEALINLPATTHDVSQLRSVFDACETQYRSLIALSVEESHFEIAFIPLVLSKLPKFVKMELYRKNGSTKWTIDGLRRMLKDEIEARDRSERTFGGNSKENGYRYDKPKQAKGSFAFAKKKPAMPTAEALVVPSTKAGKGSAKPKRPIKCAFCSEPHYSDQCTAYPDYESRVKQCTGRCHACLNPHHDTSKCTTYYCCFHCKKAGHHRSLCPEKFPKPENATVSTHVFNPLASNFLPSANTLSVQTNHSCSVMQTAWAGVVGLRAEGKARLLFDTAATKSYITRQKAKELGAREIGHQIVSLCRFKETKRKTVEHKVGSSRLLSRRVSVVDEVTTPVQIYPLNLRDPLLAKLVFAEPVVKVPTMVHIDVLIGLDYYYHFVGEKQPRCQDGLVLLSSKLGWIAGGRVSGQVGSETLATTVFACSQSVPDTSFPLEKFWALEEIGIKDKISHHEDDIAIEQFNKSIKFEDGRFQVRWPWKNEKPDLPDNYGLALGRLATLYMRISGDLQVLQKYATTISDQLKLGIIEEAPSEPTGPVHYIPHHCVITPGKATTKLRVVYDASAKAGRSQLSINECLYRGPVLLADLCGLLLRFRLNKIAMVSDVEKAFLQISLQHTERDVTRFLWLRDWSKEPTPDNLIRYRFCRVPFGYISSPFLLAGSIEHLLRNSGKSWEM